MQLLAGTSGFSYTEWRGSFYDEKLPPARMLTAYSEKLPTVEINNTFYRMPQPSLFQGWLEKVPESFSFAIKAPRAITHVQRLKDTSANVAQLLKVASILGPRLGPVLYQTPPFLKQDVQLLADFVSSLPKHVPAALEFRHISWFNDATYQVLSDAGVALCATEVDDGDGSGAPFVRTAPFIYVRLRKENYDDAELGAIRQRLEDLKVERANVYFKHEVKGPAYALKLLKLGATK